MSQVGSVPDIQVVTAKSPNRKSQKNWKKIQNVIKSAMSIMNYEEDVFYHVVFRMPDAKGSLNSGKIQRSRFR